jgi:uncharacterized membrane protein YjjP (DUF1212 family)
MRRSDIEPTPDVFAAVMAAGILSIAARDHDYPVISDTLDILAATGLTILVAVVIVTAGVNAGSQSGIWQTQMSRCGCLPSSPHVRYWPVGWPLT